MVSFGIRTEVYGCYEGQTSFFSSFFILPVPLLNFMLVGFSAAVWREFAIGTE